MEVIEKERIKRAQELANSVKTTKEAIRQAIADKDVDIPANTAFADYPSKIEGIYADALFLRSRSCPGQIPSSIKPAGIAYANGTYVVIGCQVSGGRDTDTRQYVYAKDSGQWMSGNVPESGNWSAPISANGRIIIGSKTYTNRNYVTVDGINWTKITNPENINAEKAVSAGNKFFIYSSNNSGSYHSEDGLNWTSFNYTGIQISSSKERCAFSYNSVDGKMYAFKYTLSSGQQSLWFSDDGFSFTKLFDFNNQTVNSVTNALSSFCVGGAYGIASYISSGNRNYTYIIGLQSGTCRYLDTDGPYMYPGTIYGNGFFVCTSGDSLICCTGNSEAAQIIDIPFDTYDDGFDDARISFANGMFIGWLNKKTNYSYFPALWFDDLTGAIEDKEENDTTGKVVNALLENIDPFSIIQTNTLDAAYREGVNAYIGE